MFAVVRTGGKQYRVQEGRSVRVERLPGDPGSSIELGEVLMLSDGVGVTIGTPTVSGARVLGTIAEQGRAKKIIVFKYKSKTRARKKTGHRQHFTRIVIDDILAAGQEPKPKVAAQAPAEAEAPAEPKRGRGRRKATAADAEAAAPDAAEAEAAVIEAPVAEAAEASAVTDASASVDEPAAAPADEPAPAADEKPKRGRRKAE